MVANFKIIFILLISIIISKKIDDNDESQILEGILEAMKNLKIPYKTLDDTIDQRIYLKLLKYLILNDAESFGALGGLEDAFLLKLSKEVTETVPEKIKIKDLPKYLNPRMIEPLINKILSEFDFNSMLKNLGDAFGITDTIKQKMEEREKEKAKLNLNLTNDINNSSDNNIKTGKKYSRRDLRNNGSDTNEINKDL